MTPIRHDQLSAWLGGYAQHAAETGEYTVRPLVGGPTLTQLSFSSPGRHAIVSLVASDSVDPGGSFITIVGGGAFGVPPSEGVYAQLLDHHRHLDWGGPFARLTGLDGVTFGSRLTVPSSIFEVGDFRGEGSGFLLSMLDCVADNGHALANGIVPTFGGQPFNGTAEQDTVLLAGYRGM
jgi:hypothetical protein